MGIDHLYVSGDSNILVSMSISLRIVLLMKKRYFKFHTSFNVLLLKNVDMRVSLELIKAVKRSNFGLEKTNCVLNLRAT